MKKTVLTALAVIATTACAAVCAETYEFAPATYSGGYVILPAKNPKPIVTGNEGTDGSATNSGDYVTLPAKNPKPAVTGNEENSASVPPNKPVKAVALSSTAKKTIDPAKSVKSVKEKVTEEFKSPKNSPDSPDNISFDSKKLGKTYGKITKEDRIKEALELLKGTSGEFSRKAILGNNITGKAVNVQFADLGQIKQEYAGFDALGWSRNKRLYIYINQKHSDAPAAALAALLSHEALHQDQFDSLNEETYAWTMEAAVWTQLCERDKTLEEINHPLVLRENMLKKLFEKGNYTNKYIKKSVFSNPSYSNLPTRSPGFENL